MNKHYVNRCLRWLANELVPFYLNSDLPEELNLKIDSFYDCVSDSIDWYNMTLKDVQQLGFLNWEEDEESAKNGIWFIPTWLFCTIPEGIQLVDKNGNKFEFHKTTAPTDVMYGCLTFGVLLDSEDN